MNLFQQVMVAVGDAERDTDLLAYARAVRELAPGAAFRFVHVLGWPAPSVEEPAVHRDVLVKLETAVRQHFGPCETGSCRVMHGNVIDRLLETAAESGADVILVGHGREHSGRRSLARRLAMQAPCSVWMRPEGSQAAIRRVLAAIDYSESSAHALNLAGRIVRRAGSDECFALHVYFDEMLADVPEYAEERRAGQSEAFARFTSPVDTAGVTLRPVIEAAPDVADAVERVAEAFGIDLVVMGSRGQTRSASILLGSESEHVLMQSKVPVLIAKRRGERLGLLQALLDRNFHLRDSPRFG
jgi:nucleotide-binding universal stress UspA family protein